MTKKEFEALLNQEKRNTIIYLGKEGMKAWNKAWEEEFKRTRIKNTKKI
mgnify:CR=1 FL=1